MSGHDREKLDLVEIRLENLPLFDADIMEILALLDDAETDFDDIVAKLSPEVCAKFLGLANSAFYGLKVTNINHALRVLGFDAMKQCLLTSLVMDRLAKVVDSRDFNLDKFHRQAEFCAAVARMLGDMVEYEKPADLFTAAMLHNIGKLVVAAYFPEEYAEIRSLKKGHNLPAADAERRVLGLSHAELSARVLEKFNIPRKLVLAVRYHDAFDRQTPAGSEYELERILRRAVSLVDSLVLPADLEPDRLLELLQDTVELGRENCRELRKREIQEHGYDEVFVLLLAEAVEMLREEFRGLFEERDE